MKSPVVVVVVVVALALFAHGAAAQQAQGFAEARLSLYPGVTGDSWQLVERVRPTLSAELYERVSMTVTVEAGLAQGRNTEVELARALLESELGPLLEASGLGERRYANDWLRIDDAGGYLDVDRLYLDLYTGAVDLRVGRQAVNWGSAQFFNPTDPFPEVLLAEPWRPRRGVNAMRVSVPFAALADSTVVVALDDALVEPRAAGRIRVNVLESDIAFVAAWRGGERDTLLGVDLRGTLFVGWWLEAAYFFGDEPHEEIAVGIDYSFPVFERMTVMGQYFRNGAGDERVRGSPLGDVVTLREPRDPFAPFLRGRDYLLAGSSIAFLPELSASAFVLVNLNDRSAFAIPTASYAILDWLELAGSVQLPFVLFGDGGEFRPRDEDLVVELPSPAGGGTLEADLGGLVPAATITVWTRINY